MKPSFLFLNTISCLYKLLVITLFFLASAVSYAAKSNERVLNVQSNVSSEMVSARIVFTYIGNKGGGAGDVFIYNVQGEQVFYGEFESSGMESVQTIELEPGTYMIEGMGTPANSYFNQTFEVGNNDLQISLEVDENNWHVLI